LPRGGVPVGFELSERLEIPLGIFLVRKLGVPGHEEFAMGAIASGGIPFIHDETVRRLGISSDEVEQVVEKEKRELARRAESYGREFSPENLKDKIVILTDDGLATGATMRSAVHAIRQQQPKKIIVAVPVGAASTVHELRNVADEMVCVLVPDNFYAVGEWYAEFSQTSDDEVRELLRRTREKDFSSTPANPTFEGRF
jgi:putative phosphoribosyl transferase